MRLVLLNSLPLAFKGPCYLYHVFLIEPISAQSLQKLANEADEIACYIRHNSTLSILNSLLGVELTPSNEKYQFCYNNNDVVVVVKARNYNRDGGEVEKPELEFYEVMYYDGPDVINV